MHTESEIRAMLSDWGAIDATPGQTFPVRTPETITVQALFRQKYVEIGGVGDIYPTVMCLTVDIPGIVKGSMIENGSDKYKVSQPQFANNGMTLLVLEKPDG